MTVSASRRALLLTLASTTTLTRIALIAAAGFASSAHAGAPLPVGGTVVSGAAQIGTSGTTTTVTQGSAKAVVNWASFDVGAGHAVVFAQPDARSATLNRVTGDTSSTIAGNIKSNGSVYLVNPNGIAITSSGAVQTGGGFIASTLDISNDDFNAGRLNYTGSGASKGVSNAGRIAAGSGAYVALLGGSVSNSGTISVPLGKVGLGAGKRIALDLNGDGFMQVAVPTSAGGIDMSGSIAGARVELRASTVKDAIRNIVNVPGSISADSATGNAGSIVLLASGGTLNASGTLTARATGTTGNGGVVETSGDSVNFARLRVDTSSAGGKTGTWLVDPTDLTVDAAAATIIQNNLATSNVTLQTTSTTASGPGNQSAGNGDITIAAPVTWTSANTLGLLAYNNINLNAAITGTAGGLTLTAGNGVANTGMISAPGAVNIGVFNLTNGAWNQNTATLPAFAATNFMFNPANAIFLRVTGGNGSTSTPYQITDVYGLQGLASSVLLNSNSVITRDIDARGTAAWYGGAGFVPIGLGADRGNSGPLGGNGYGGIFDGLGHTITGLTTVDSDFAGLISYMNVGMIKNIGLVDVSVRGGNQTGGLVGHSFGTGVTNSYVTGTVSGTTNVGGLGGLVNGLVSYSYSSATVTATGNEHVGGLVGLAGAIANSYATGTVTSGGNFVGGLAGISSNLSNVYATGAVSGSTSVGGLTGYSGGDITNAYATGTVRGAGSVGGLVGTQAYGTIAGVYASGATATTSGFGLVGGLVGNQSATVSNAYWDSYSTGQSSASNGGGTSTSLFAVTSDPTQSAAANYAFKSSAYANLIPASGIGTSSASGFVFLPRNTTRPFLAFEVPSAATSGADVSGNVLIANSHQLQLIGYDAARLSASYTLAGNIDLAETGAVVAGVPGSYSGMWAGTGFVPLGTDGGGKVYNSGTAAFDVNGTSGFSGALNGAGYTVANLTVKRPGVLDVGMFGWTTGTLRNLTLTGASVTGGNNVGGLTGYLYSGSSSVSGVSIAGTTSGTSNVGGIVGLQYQAGVTGSSASGAVSGFSNIGGITGFEQSSTITGTSASASATASNAYAGGLVGYQLNGTTNSNVSASGAVSAPNGAGGLSGITVGFANAADASTTATITNASATGNVSGNDGTGGLVGFLGYNASVSQAYASGAINGVTNVGGLVGYHYSSNIADSYATGAVAGTTNIGGLVGIADSATVARTYATGSVTGTTNAGGLIGSAINAASATASVWDTQTTGQATSAGGTGYTTAQLQDATNYPNIYTGWDFNSVWQPPNLAGQNSITAPHYPRLRARPTP